MTVHPRRKLRLTSMVIFSSLRHLTLRFSGGAQRRPFPAGSPRFTARKLELLPARPHDLHAGRDETQLLLVTRLEGHPAARSLADGRDGPFGLHGLSGIRHGVLHEVGEGDLRRVPERRTELAGGAEERAGRGA